MNDQLFVTFFYVMVWEVFEKIKVTDTQLKTGAATENKGKGEEKITC